MDLATVRIMLEPAIEARQIELYNIEFLTEHGRQILRLYIDKDDGVTLDDCEEITYIVQPILDANDPFPGSYVLEVSSPGIERKLIKDSHYMANIGKEVEVRLNKPLGKQKKFRGVLLGLEKEAILIDTGEKLRLPREHLAYCRLVFTF